MEKKKKNVLILVDVINDFFPGGPLGVANGNAIIPFLNTLLAHWTKNGWTIIFVRDQHPPVTAHFYKWPVHGVAGTVGSEFHPDIILPERYSVFAKGQSMIDDGYSGFEAVGEDNESLDAVLHFIDATDLYIVGIATDWCDKATVLDGLKLGYNVTVVTDAVAAVNIHPNDGELALQEMQAAGAVLKTTQEILDEN